VEWCHVCWPPLTAKRVEPVVSISWASCYSLCKLPLIRPTASACELWSYHHMALYRNLLLVLVVTNVCCRQRSFLITTKYALRIDWHFEWELGLQGPGNLMWGVLIEIIQVVSARSRSSRWSNITPGNCYSWLTWTVTTSFPRDIIW